MDTPTLVGLATIFIVFIVLPTYLIFRIKKRFTKKECMICHELTAGKRKVRGSVVIEIFLWFLFIVPGIFYTLWRLSSDEFVCSYCGGQYLKQLSKAELKEAKRIKQNKKENISLEKTA